MSLCPVPPGGQFEPVPADALTVRAASRHWGIDGRRFRGLVKEALAALPPPEGGGGWRFDLAFELAGARRMRTLNEIQLGHAGTTDVITLDYGAPPGARADQAWLCGEVFLCVDEARVQARRYGTSWAAELIRYAVHGLLHLAGFDDRTPAQRRRMKRVEDRLVRRLRARFPLSALQRGTRVRQ